MNVETLTRAIAYAFEGQGEAWTDDSSGDRLARVAAEAVAPLFDAAPDPEPRPVKRLFTFLVDVPGDEDWDADDVREAIGSGESDMYNDESIDQSLFTDAAGSRPGLTRKDHDSS